MRADDYGNAVAGLDELLKLPYPGAWRVADDEVSGQVDNLGPILDHFFRDVFDLKRIISFGLFLTGVSFFSLSCHSRAEQTAVLRFGVSVPEALSKEPLDGRMLLMFSTDGSSEPRFQISVAEKTQLAFGIDVEDLRPNTKALFDSKVFGYPLKSTADLPLGEYWVQALLDRYETFHRSDGYVVKLPMDRGEDSRWNFAPGNLYSAIPE